MKRLKAGIGSGERAARKRRVQARLKTRLDPPYDLPMPVNSGSDFILWIRTSMCQT